MSESSHQKPGPNEFELENKKIRQLRLMVDLTIAALQTEELSVTEMLNLVSKTKNFALYLFPDKEQVFDLIYKPRFEKIIKERIESN